MENYRVIKILDDYSILINYGFSQGAKYGDDLRIYIPGEEIIDPVTGKNLGRLDKIKEIVTVSMPYENFSVCKKISNKIIDVLNPLSAMFEKSIATQHKLNINESEYDSFTIKSKDPIVVGDIAHLLPK